MYQEIIRINEFQYRLCYYGHYDPNSVDCQFAMHQQVKNVNAKIVSFAQDGVVVEFY